MIEKWEKLKTERVFDGFKKIDKTTFKLPDGKTKDFDIVVNHDEVASVVGITKDKEVILVEQFRPGPEKIFHEFPLGFVDKGESPIEAAKREFLKETGYTGKFEKTGTLYLMAYSKTKVHCFVAVDCQKITDKLKLDDAEFIDVHLAPLEKLRQMLKSGEVRNFGEGYLALDHLGLL